MSGPFLDFLVNIAQSADIDRLLCDMDPVKNYATEATPTAAQAPASKICDPWDTLTWLVAEGTMQAITAITGAWTPRGLLLTANVTVATVRSDIGNIENASLALAQGGPLLDYISWDPNAISTWLVTRWNPNHAPISPPCLRQAVLHTMYTAREKVLSPKPDAAPHTQNQDATYKPKKPIS